MAGPAIVSTARLTAEDVQANGHRTCFEYAGVRTAYLSDEDASALWIARFLEGYFEPVGSTQPDATICSTADPALFASLQRLVSETALAKDQHVDIPLTEDVVLIHTRATKVTPAEDVYRLLFTKERDIVLVTSGNAEVRREEGMQTLRSLGKWLLIEQGWVPMHSACAAKDGQAICIAGEKASGKTSTLLNLLARNGCDLVAIDKFLLRDAPTHMEVCGVPGKAGIRIGSAVGHPQVLGWLDDEAPSFFPHVSREEVHTIAASNTPEQLRHRKEKINILPTELTQLLQTGMTPTAALDLILIPVFDLGVETSRLVPADPQQASRMLTACYSGLLSKGEDYLHYFFDVGDAILRERLASMLDTHAARTRAYELFQNQDTNDQTALLMDGLLRSGQRLP